MDVQTQSLHASCVAIGDFGILIIGPSGSGKSGLALRLMALGACLVADDRTSVTAHENHITATAPDSIRGLIEARGVGLLQAGIMAKTRISLVVDMSRIEKHRLPAPRRYNLLGHSLTLLHKVETDYFPAAILQIAKSGGLTQID